MLALLVPFAFALASLASGAIPAFAQPAATQARPCAAEMETEQARHRSVALELSKDRAQAAMEHRNRLIDCRDDRDCQLQSHATYRDAQDAIRKRQNEEATLHRNNRLEIGSTCSSREPAALRAQTPQLDPGPQPLTEAEVRRRLPATWSYDPSPYSGSGTLAEVVSAEGTHIFVGPDNKAYLFPRSHQGMLLDSSTIRLESMQRPGSDVATKHAAAVYRGSGYYQELRGVPADAVMAPTR